MVGRLHSRQGLQSGRGAVGEGPSLLLDIFFFTSRGMDVQTSRPHYCHNYIVMVFVCAQSKKGRVLDRNAQTLVWSLFFRVSPIYRETSCSFFCHIIL